MLPLRKHPSMSGKSTLWLHRSFQFSATAATEMCRGSCDEVCHGLPRTITIDRDPRFVGSPGSRDFPAPFLRFLLCLGIAVTVCPPRRPDKNAFVERYHRTLESECLKVHRPATLEQPPAPGSAHRLP